MDCSNSPEQEDDSDISLSSEKTFKSKSSASIDTHEEDQLNSSNGSPISDKDSNILKPCSSESQNDSETNNQEESVDPTVTVIYDTSAAEKAIRELKKCKILGFDTEFGQRGNSSPDNILSILQFGTSDRRIYIFDVLDSREGILQLPGLKDIFESEQITKVIHGCINDSKLLYKQASIKMKKVFDTQVRQQIIEYSKKVPIKEVSQTNLQLLCTSYQVRPNESNIEGKLWELVLERLDGGRIRDDILAYAANDVKCLLPLYTEMNRQHEHLGEMFERHFKIMCETSLYKQLDLGDEANNDKNKHEYERREEGRKKELKIFYAVE